MVEKVLVCNLLEFSMANALVIYKQHNKGSIKNDKSRLDIFTGLMKGYENPSTSFRRPASNPHARLTTHHIPTLNQHRRPNEKCPKPDSEVCSSGNEKRNQTQVYCVECKMPCVHFSAFGGFTHWWTTRCTALSSYMIHCNRQIN